MKIVVQHIKPPIPVRFWDWQACIEGKEENQELYGWGPSKEAAVAELMNILLDRCEHRKEVEEVSEAHTEFWNSQL